MASNREQRVDDALQQLVSRLIPSNLEGDDPEEDQRWEDSIALARRIIDTDQSPTTSTDTSQAADLIRSKLLRDTGRPDRATKFSNLYSRLLTQPVLGQKWAILQFLYKLAEPDTEKLQQRLERLGDGALSSPEPVNGVHARQRSGIDRDRERVSSQESRRDGITSPVAEPRTRRRIQRTTPPASPRQGGRREQYTYRPSSRRQKETEPEAALPKQPSNPTEAQLLRDLPFTLQGLSSTNLPFRDRKGLMIPPGLPVPLVSLLHMLAEPSLLYRSLAAFVEQEEGGLVGQSLRSAIGEELRDYLGLVATLEGQIRKALVQVGEDSSRRGLGKAGVTLKRCVVWTREATLGLRLMSMIAEESTGKKGGSLISLIHLLSTNHGDPFVHTFAERLLHKVTKPFYIMLEHWIFSGNLEDPYREFFISEMPDIEQGSATSIWTDKFRLEESLVPSIISSDLAQKIFLIGKSLNFIRSSCSDSSWVESYTASSSKQLSLSDPTALSSAIDESYTLTTARVLQLMSEKFALFDHLSALKKYLLLGQGDFIALLLESLAANLDGPANAQYRHHLTSALDHSIRNSNAQYEPQDITRRLDARMLELSHGEIGWDVFTLEYRMDSPLDVVVGAWAQKQYLKIFNFLWRIKRVEFTLGSVWGRCMTGSRGVLRFVGEKGRPASQEEGDTELQDAWKRARGGLAAMVHFVGQLQYYILFEVIESGWEKLKAEMAKPSATLDTLITAHTAYLHNITRKGLLASSTTSSSSGAHVADFTSQLHELLKLMLAYKDTIESLYSHSVAEFTRRQDHAARIDRRTEAGQWGVSEADERSAPRSAFLSNPLIRIPGEDDEPDDGIGRIKKRLLELEIEFKTRVNVLLGDLAYQQDTDMRFLGVVMNFNDVYRPVRRRRHGHGHGKERDKERGKAEQRGDDRSATKTEVQAGEGSGQEQAS